MSKQFNRFKLVIDRCEQELDEFAALLDNKVDLSERADLLPFFAARRHLATLSASWNLHVAELDLIDFELDLFGNFRCDWAVGNSQTGQFVLVEVEDARSNSLFERDPRFHNAWGARFEHGFSQMVDWFWALDMYRDNVDFAKRFGGNLTSFSGLLLIGRDRHLDDAMRQRLRWRVDNVLINSNKILCMTFDELRNRAEHRLAALRELVQGT